MICPNCGASHDASCRYCTVCGTPRPAGSHRTPLLILLAMALAGILLWFALPDAPQAPVPAEETHPTASWHQSV